MRSVPPSNQRIIWDDGERWLPWLADPVSMTGFNLRLRLAERLCMGGRVLVLGSGEGFGAASLAAMAEQVIAGDGNSDCIMHARYNYRRDNLVFVHQQPCELVKAIDGTFQLVVAFEWSEPVEVTEAVIEGAERVLADDGVLMLCEADPYPRRGGAGPPRRPPLLGRPPAPAAVTSQLRGHFDEVVCWQLVGASAVEVEDPVHDGTARHGHPMVFAASHLPLNGAAVSGAEPVTDDDGLVGHEPPPDAVTAPAASFDSLDELALRRQVAAYDSAVSKAMQDARGARLEIEVVRADLEIVEIQLSAARHRAAVAEETAEALRCELDQVRDELRAAREESAGLVPRPAPSRDAFVVRGVRSGRRRLRRALRALAGR